MTSKVDAFLLSETASRLALYFTREPFVDYSL